MRPALVPLLLVLAACNRTTPEGAELTHDQCGELVRHVQRLESADTGGLRTALHVGRKGGVEGCLERGTDRAYRCVMQAEAVGDLEACESLYK